MNSSDASGLFLCIEDQQCCVGRGHDPVDQPPKTARQNSLHKGSNRVGGVVLRAEDAVDQFIKYSLAHNFTSSLYIL